MYKTNDVKISKFENATIFATHCFNKVSIFKLSNFQIFKLNVCVRYNIIQNLKQ